MVKRKFHGRIWLWLLEFDLVAVNDLRKEVVFADIKLDTSRIDLKALKEKSSKLTEEYKGYKT